MSNHAATLGSDPRRSAIMKLVAADGHDVSLSLEAEFAAGLRRQMSPSVASAVEAVEATCGIPLLVTCADELLRDRDLRYGAELFALQGYRELTEIKLACARELYGRAIRDVKLIWDTAPFDRSLEVKTYVAILVHLDDVFGERFKAAAERWNDSEAGRACQRRPRSAGGLAFAAKWGHALDHYYWIYGERLARCGMKIDGKPTSAGNDRQVADSAAVTPS